MQEKQCNFVQAVINPNSPTWEYTTTQLGPIVPYDIQDKAKFLLEIWRDLNYNTGGPEASLQSNIKSKILYKLGDLIDKAFEKENIADKKEDLKIEIPYDHIPYLESQPIQYTGDKNIYFQQAVEQQKKEQEKQEFINFMLEVLAVAEANQQNKFN